MKLCAARRESGPARVPRSTLWTGVDRPQCGELTSTDHSSYEGGGNVTVTQYDDYVSLENKRAFSNAENNPADVVLTEEQKSMHNCAKWPFTILMAGISNKQWEGVVTPSPTPYLTESSPTPSPTPSPTCGFSYRFGTVHCGVRLHQLPWRLLFE